MATTAKAASGKAPAATIPDRKINRLRDLKVGVRDLIMLDPRDIKVEKGFNPRNYHLAENHAHLDELKRSIAQMGVQVPLLVRYDAENRQAILVDGECRLRAVLELIREGVEMASVPVAQVPGNNPADRLVLSITANTGKPLSAWEAGGGFQRLVNYGWEPPQIAERTGYSEKYVREAIELADADDEVKQLLSERAVTPSLALYHIRRKGAGAGVALREAAEAAKASGKKTATNPALSRKQPSPSPSPQPSQPQPVSAPVPVAASTATVRLATEDFVEAIRDLFDDMVYDKRERDGGIDTEQVQVTVSRDKLMALGVLAGVDGWWT